jgi:hypothetical protein
MGICLASGDFLGFWNLISFQNYWPTSLFAIDNFPCIFKIVNMIFFLVVVMDLM